jgi:hypothetical protein
MGNVSRARKIIQSKHLSTNASSINVWEGDQTWLSIFFHKSLFIFGFGLDENEVFFRWLLIERAKYYKRYPLFKQKGWYVMIKDADENINKGKLFFLQSVGIEVITLNTYQELYEKIWE